MITRKQLAAHMEDYILSGAADNPEYGGDRVDWVWDWLVSQGMTGPATGPHIYWLQLDTRDNATDKTR